MVERGAGWIEPCSLGAAWRGQDDRRKPPPAAVTYRASAVAAGRKWHYRDDRLRSAEFGYGGEDAAAERDLVNGVSCQSIGAARPPSADKPSDRAWYPSICGKA